MSDAYQPIFDAVRSRISGCDVGNAVADAVRQAFDISHLTGGVAQDFTIAAMEMQRPFVLLKPRLFPDGNQWCALYGENLQEGVVGFGSSPAKAAQDFDKNWLADMPAKVAAAPALDAAMGRDQWPAFMAEKSKA